ncbi:MAG: peptidoglycan-binding domain-containing protein [Egibacteraceae bacterium]
MSNTPLVRYLVDDVVVPLRLPRLDELLARSQPGPLDLRLTFASRLLARLPWELLRTPRGPLWADDRVRFLYRAPAQPQADRVQTRALQRALMRIGFDPGDADGLLGPDTESAIKAFQHSVGRSVDGFAGPHTWKALRERLLAQRTDRSPHVLVLRRDTAGELAASRSRSLEGYGIEDLYRQAGFEVTAIGDPEALQLPAPQSGTPVDVLHISTTMQSTGTVPTIDFGSATYGSESPWQHAQTELLAVTSAEHLVKELSSADRTPPGGARPHPPAWAERDHEPAAAPQRLRAPAHRPRLDRDGDRDRPGRPGTE